MVKSYFVIFILLYLVSQQLCASPKKEVLEKYQKELSQEIPFKFSKKPLMEILEDIKKKSEINIIIDEQSILDETPKIVSKLSAMKSLGKSAKNNKEDSGPIDYSQYQFPELTFNFESLTIKDALLWLEELTYLDFEVSEKGIFISTKEALIKPLVTLNIYDFSSLFFKPQNFYSLSILNEWGGEESYIQRKSQNIAEINPSEHDIVSMIKENIKDGNWDLKTISISLNGNMLNIINTPEVHQKVKTLIDKTQSVSQKQIAIDFKLIQTPIDAFDKLFEGSTKGIFLSKEAYKKLILTEIPTIKEAVEINSSNIVCFNDQIVFTFCGQGKNFVLDYNIVDGVPDPAIVTSYVKGFDFEIHPIVSFDNSHINLDLVSNHILNTEEITQEIKIQAEKNGGLGVNIKGDLNGKGEADKKETKEEFNINGSVESKGELVVQAKTQSKVGEISKLQQSTCKFMQSLILENGGAVILKRSFGKTRENKSYYFIIHAQTIELKN